MMRRTLMASGSCMLSMRKPNARDTLIEKENQLLVKRLMTVKSVFDPNGKDLEEFRTHQRRVQVMQEFRGSACARPPPPPVPEPKPSKPRVAASLSDTNLRHLSALLCPWDLPAKRSTVQPQSQADTMRADVSPEEPQPRAQPAELAVATSPQPMGTMASEAEATAVSSSSGPSGPSPESSAPPHADSATPLQSTSLSPPHQTQTAQSQPTTTSPSPYALPSGSASQEAAETPDHLAGPASITASPPQAHAVPAPAPGTLSSDRHADPFGDLDLFGNRGIGTGPAAAAPAAANETAQSRPADPFGGLDYAGNRAGTDADARTEATALPSAQAEPGLTNAMTAQPDRHADPFGELDIFGNSEAKPAEGGGRPRRRRG
ncbi:ANKRD17 [Symbiodinium sp. CCMP2456]|nr:ANKRD17 [Symbiodinium sp. CCMP2456]